MFKLKELGFIDDSDSYGHTFTYEIKKNKIPSYHIIVTRAYIDFNGNWNCYLQREGDSILITKQCTFKNVENLLNSLKLM